MGKSNTKKTRMSGTIVKTKNPGHVSLEEMKTKLYGPRGTDKRDAAEKRIQDIIDRDKKILKRSEKLWDKLCKELKPLDDNNHTARRIFDYVERIYNHG